MMSLIYMTYRENVRIMKDIVKKLAVFQVFKNHRSSWWNKIVSNDRIKKKRKLFYWAITKTFCKLHRNVEVTAYICFVVYHTCIISLGLSFSLAGGLSGEVTETSPTITLPSSLFELYTNVSQQNFRSKLLFLV